MATCTLGPIVSSVSGVVGGVEFRQSGGVTVLQARPIVSSKETISQMAQRSLIARYRDKFNALSDVNATKWLQFAVWWNKNVRKSGAPSMSSLDLFVSWQCAIQHDDTLTIGLEKPPFQYVSPLIVPASWSVNGALPWHCTIARANDGKHYGVYSFWRQTTYTGNNKTAGTWYRAHSSFNVAGNIYSYAFSDGLQELVSRMASPGKLEVRFHWVQWDTDNTVPSGLYTRWQSVGQKVSLSRA